MNTSPLTRRTSKEYKSLPGSEAVATTVTLAPAASKGAEEGLAVAEVMDAVGATLTTVKGTASCTTGCGRGWGWVDGAAPK